MSVSEIESRVFRHSPSLKVSAQPINKHYNNSTATVHAIEMEGEVLMLVRVSQ